jgi:hypothetical protein
MEFIIRGKARFGKQRSEQEANLRKEGMSSLSDEQLDRVKYIEKKQKDRFGLSESFIDQKHIGGESIKTKDD